MNRPGRSIAIFATFVFLMLCIAYSNHFHNGFHFDDSHAVQDNVYIRNLKNVPSFFSDPRMFSADPSHWGLRPLVTTTLAIDYWLGGGLNPFYFQLSTFIWYVVLCVMLYFIYKNLLNRSVKPEWAAYMALIAAAWFALHTVNAETVNYIIARSDILSTLCIAASFLIYIALPDKRKLYLYIIPAFIGVFAKETVAVLVIILFFYMLLFESKLSIADLFKPANFKVVLNTLVKLLPIAVVVVITQLYMLSKVPAIAGATSSTGYYILNQGYIWLHYFIAFFLPTGLSADTDWSVIRDVTDLRILMGLAFVIALIVAIFKTSAKAQTKPIAFGLIWFIAALLPTSLVPFSEITNDHRMFFPFIGLVLSVVTYIGMLLTKWETQFIANPQYKTYIGIAVFVVLSLNAYGVHERNKVWKDEESLWRDVTIKSPLNGRGLMNYGLTQMAKGNYPTADSCFTKAVFYLPYYSTLYINIGILKGATNNPREADDNFKKAIGLSPNSFEPYYYYARYLNKMSRVGDALPLAEKALQLNSTSLLALNLLMNIYSGLGMWDKLIVTANATLAILPGDATAQTYLQAGKNRQPVVVTNTPTGIKTPTTADDYVNLSLIYYNQQQYDKCIDACMQAIKLKADDADAYSNMGAAYNQLKQWDKAIDACNKALKINPAHRLANGNLNWAHTQMKKQ